MPIVYALCEGGAPKRFTTASGSLDMGIVASAFGLQAFGLRINGVYMPSGVTDPDWQDGLGPPSGTSAEDAYVVSGNPCGAMDEERDRAGHGAGGRGGATTSSEGQSVCVIFTKQGKSKDRQTKSEVFRDMPTFQRLKESVETIFPQFLTEAYDLMVGSTLLHSGNWPVAAQHACGRKKMNSNLEVAVVSTCRAYNTFKAEEGLQLLGVKGVTSSAELFSYPDLQMDVGLLERVTEITGWKTIKDVLNHMGCDVALRALLSDPRKNRLEARSREIISPPLVAAAILASAGDIELYAKCLVEGVRARGSPDWVMRYMELDIAVVEAKPHTKWEDHIGQLAAEMMGSRERFAVNILGKRKEEVGDAMPEVPSWGILTNGIEYQFYRYLSKELLASDPVSINLRRGMKAEQAIKELLPVISFIKKILEEQMAHAHNIRQPKRLRVDTA